MGLKNVYVPRDPEDRKTADALQRTHEAIDQLGLLAGEYSIETPINHGRPEGMPSGNAVRTAFSLAAGNVDSVVFKVPALPSGAGRFVGMRFFVRLETAIVGAGSVLVRLGTTAGGNDIGTDQTVTSATALGLIFSGLSRASRGSALLVANCYEVSLAAGATINLRATTTGTITAGACMTYSYGAWLP